MALSIIEDFKTLTDKARRHKSFLLDGDCGYKKDNLETSDDINFLLLTIFSWRFVDAKRSKAKIPRKLFIHKSASFEDIVELSKKYVYLNL